jgi:hypothetical protein
MRIDDVIYFAPEIKVVDFDITNKNQVLEGFKSRINSYYLKPAAKLNELEEAFASGVILMTAIDAITYYSIGGNNRIKDFMAQCHLIAHFNEQERKAIVKGFDDYFRNGLVHEGRIKNGCQFSYQYGFTYFDNTFLVINPHILHDTIVEYFATYFEELTKDENVYNRFYQKFFRQFNPEVAELKRVCR